MLSNDDFEAEVKHHAAMMRIEIEWALKRLDDMENLSRRGRTTIDDLCRIQETLTNIIQDLRIAQYHAWRYRSQLGKR